MNNLELKINNKMQILADSLERERKDLQSMYDNQDYKDTVEAWKKGIGWGYKGKTKEDFDCWMDELSLQKERIRAIEADLDLLKDLVG